MKKKKEYNRVASHEGIPIHPSCPEKMMLTLLTTRKQTTEFLSANQKKVKSKLYDNENPKTKGQTV